MGKMRVALTGILFWAAMFSSLYFLTNFPGVGGLESFDTLSFTLLTTIIAVLVSVYYFIEHFVNKMKVDWILLLSFVVILTIGLISIWTTKDVTTIEEYGTGVTHDVFVSFKDRLRNTIQFVTAVIMCYTLCFPACRRYFSTKKFLWFANAIVLFSFATIVISFFTDLDVYKQFFVDHTVINDGVKAFYQNENTYGFAMLLGIIACMMINVRRGRWWSYLLIIAFYFAMIFSICSTTIIIASSMLTIYFFAEIFRTIKKHPGWNTLYLVLYISVLVTLFALYGLGKGSNDSFLKNFADFIDSIIFKHQFTDLSRRFLDWKEAMSLITDEPMHLIFGRGYGFAKTFLEVASSIHIHTAHSGFVQILITYGIVGLVLYCLAIIYFFVVIIKLLRLKQTKFALYSSLVFIAVVGRSIMESSYFFMMSFDGLVSTFLILLPVFAVYKQYKHPKLRNYLLRTPMLKGGIGKSTAIKVATAAITGMLVAALLLLTTKYPHENTYFMEGLLMFFVFMGVSLIFVPYIISLLYYRNSNKTFINILITLAVASVAIIVFVTYMVWYFCGQTWHQVMITAPCVYAGLCVLYLLFLMPIYRSGLKVWFHNFLTGIFVTPFFGLLVLVLTEGIPLWFLSATDELNDLSLALIVTAGMMMFFITFLWFPFKSNYKILRELNDSMIFTLKRDAVNTEIYQ